MLESGNGMKVGLRCLDLPIAMLDDLAAGMPTMSEWYDDITKSMGRKFRTAANPEVAFMKNALQKLPPAQPGMEYTTLLIAVEGTLLQKKWDVSRAADLDHIIVLIKCRGDMASAM